MKYEKYMIRIVIDVWISDNVVNVRAAACGGVREKKIERWRTNVWHYLTCCSPLLSFLLNKNVNVKLVLQFRLTIKSCESLRFLMLFSLFLCAWLGTQTRRNSCWKVDLLLNIYNFFLLHNFIVLSCDDDENVREEKGKFKLRKGNKNMSLKGWWWWWWCGE